MSDDLSRRAPEDPTKVNVNEPWEVRYWTNRFNVTGLHPVWTGQAA